MKIPRTNDELVVIQGKVWNKLASEIERLANIVVAPPLEKTMTATGTLLRLNQSPYETIWARITDVYDDGYPWTEAKPQSDGTFTDVENGRNSDDNGVAYEANGGTDDLTDTYVLLRRGIATDDGTRTWHFGGPPAPGSSITPIKIVNTWTGNAKYQCNDLGNGILAPTINTVDDVDDAFFAGPDLISATNTIAINLAEAGLSEGHILETDGTDPRVFLARNCGIFSDGGSGAWTVYLFWGVQLKFDCPPLP